MSNKMIEDAINVLLKGDAQKNALDLVAHIREGGTPGKKTGGITVVQWDENEFMWFVKNEEEIVDLIYISGIDDDIVCPGPWTVWIRGDHIGEHEDGPVDDQTKEVAWAHVAICKPCSDDCNRGCQKIIFGKEFAKVCPDTLIFSNPDAETLSYIKKIREIRNNDIRKRFEKGKN